MNDAPKKNRRARKFRRSRKVSVSQLMLAWRRRVTIGKFKAALKLVPHEMLKLAPHDESRNNRPGTRVDHHPSLTRRHHVTIQGARVREEIAPGILCAPHGRGAGAGR